MCAQSRSWNVKDIQYVVISFCPLHQKLNHAYNTVNKCGGWDSLFQDNQNLENIFSDRGSTFHYKWRFFMLKNRMKLFILLNKFRL